MNKNAVGLVALAMLLIGVILGISLMTMRSFLPSHSDEQLANRPAAADPFATPMLRDAEDLRGFSLLVSGLEKFRERNNSYPDTLNDLVDRGIMNAIPMEPIAGGGWREYRYVPWMKVDAPGLCSMDGVPHCLGYHLGASLEDPRHLLLGVDADASEMGLGRNFSGLDSSGCFHEEGMGCFDVTAAHPYAAALGALTVARAKNTAYQIGEDHFTLLDGIETRPIPGSAIIERVSIVGGPVAGDLTGDSIPDAALALAYNAGGSGTFISLAAAIALPNGQLVGTPAVGLGDRITVRSIVIEKGVIVVDLLVRAPNEPFSAAPTVPESRRFILVGESLVEQLKR
ncbi:MAG TPA: hypothetical protein VLB83_03455 [Candidatus Paceibacterota bacterium]|nr:hypothetical protein [Candidatus Paceibacterota bacterium]